MKIEDVRRLFPNLQIIRQVGQGAFKLVFEAYREEERLALKILSPDVDLVRLRREASALKAIQSPFVPKLIEFKVEESDQISIAYLLEEFIEGEELWANLQRGSIYSPSELISFLDMVLQGLEACGSKRIIHRDIKPQNIVVRSDGTPVIVDFGLSRHLDLSSLTPTGATGIIGTPAYAPPEVLRYSKREIDGKSDLYSLGITAYMMATGRHPFIDINNPGEDWYSKMLAAQAQPPSEINQAIPANLSKYIMRLIKPNRIDRFKDASHARNKLQELIIN